MTSTNEIRQPGEIKFANELKVLVAEDRAPKPPGWLLSPRAVSKYVLGGSGITAKYIGDASIVEVAIATLASERALMFVGEPGTAKSWLSEHLAAAISGSSRSIIQGTAGTTEEQIKYGWNYSLLLAEGPSEKALVPSPMIRAMRQGKLVRFEELTRSAPEVQDAMISILSEKQIAIPELDTLVFAERGFNVIATANTRDRGVNEMSSALKRRFNFVTVPLVSDLEQEIKIVSQREAELRNEYNVGIEPPAEIAKMLVTLFQELRAGITKDGKTKVRSPSTVLSTGEAISVLFESGILAQHFGSGRVTAVELSKILIGAVSKESLDDVKVIREYCETVAKGRGGAWKELHAASKTI